MTPPIPCTLNRLQGAVRRVREARITETCGRVVQLIGLVIESEGPLAASAGREGVNGFDSGLKNVSDALPFERMRWP